MQLNPYPRSISNFLYIENTQEKARTPSLHHLLSKPTPTSQKTCAGGRQFDLPTEATASIHDDKH